MNAAPSVLFNSAHALSTPRVIAGGPQLKTPIFDACKIDEQDYNFVALPGEILKRLAVGQWKSLKSQFSVHLFND